MKKNKTLLTVVLALVTVVLLASTLYISSLLSTPSSPTQIKKTKAAPVAYTKTVNFADFPSNSPTTPAPSSSPSVIPESKPSSVPSPTTAVTIIAKAPTLVPTKAPILIAQALTPTPSTAPTVIPKISTPTPAPSPTLQPLLAYKSTSISPTLSPLGVVDPTKAPTPTKKVAPTGVQQLPETGWIQTSSILFIVATSTILFSLLY